MRAFGRTVTITAAVVEAGAAFVAPHVEILKDYVLKHTPCTWHAHTHHRTRWKATC
jgi:hypothetical protein